jgi:phosphatidylinositol alpha 1,6-mannosyltransferase
VRIAVVTESFLPSINGVTNSVLRVLETLRNRGHDTLVVSPTSPASDYLGSRIITTPSVLLAGFPVAVPGTAVGQALDDFRPDIVHAAAPFLLGGYALSWAKKRNVPSVAVYQTDVAGYMARYGLDFATPLIDAMTASIHRLATVNLVPTPDGQAYLNGLGISGAQVWGRGVDTDLFSAVRRGSLAASKLRQAVAPGGERIIGYVGRLAPEKQVERLKELVDLPHTKILIVGDGPSRSSLEDLFRFDPVVFTGRLGGEDLATAYAAMDVFVHCGTEETFGQTIQEAHASGLPVIAPQKGGQRHLIRDGVDGFLVDHTRWGAFRERALLLLEDDLLRARSAHEAVVAVAGKTWEANNAALVSHYEALVAPVAASMAAA